MLPFPTQWLAPAALARLVLLLNHVVASEPQALTRLKPHAGRAIDIRWASAALGSSPAWWSRLLPDPARLPTARLLITPAGLFELMDEGAAAPASESLPLQGLSLTVQLGEPLDLLKRAARGERPEVSIEGDANLAEAAAWLMKNLRWDVQDDVARLLGNLPAEGLRKLSLAIREALLRWRPNSGDPR